MLFWICEIAKFSFFIEFVKVFSTFWPDRTTICSVTWMPYGRRLSWSRGARIAIGKDVAKFSPWNGFAMIPSWVITIEIWIINVIHAIESFSTAPLTRIAIAKGVTKVYSWNTISMTTRWVFALGKWLMNVKHVIIVSQRKNAYMTLRLFNIGFTIAKGVVMISPRNSIVMTTLWVTTFNNLF